MALLCCQAIGGTLFILFTAVIWLQVFFFTLRLKHQVQINTAVLLTGHHYPVMKCFSLGGCGLFQDGSTPIKKTQDLSEWGWKWCKSYAMDLAFTLTRPQPSGRSWSDDNTLLLLDIILCLLHLCFFLNEIHKFIFKIVWKASFQRNHGRSSEMHRS